MIGDEVRIVKEYCADSAYVGLKGIVVEEFNDPGQSRRVKVTLPKDDDKYYLGDRIIIPLSCLKLKKK